MTDENFAYGVAMKTNQTLQAIVCFAAVVICGWSLYPATTFAQPTTKPSAALKMIKTLPIGGEGRWDYITVDPTTHRLYVSRSSHTQVIDSESGKVLADWPDTAGAHGVAIVAAKQLAFTSNGRSDSVSVFDLKTNEKLADVAVGSGPDAICYDAASNNVLVFNHKGGTVTLIAADADAKFKTQTLEVGGTLEAGAVDGEGHAFVNVEDKNEVVEFDTKSPAVLNHWKLGKGEGPTGIAIDVAKHRLFVGCGENGLLEVLNSKSGKVIAALPMGDGCDGVDFDPALGQAYASCGDGTLAVAGESADGNLAIMQTVPTKRGARTLAVDPSTHLIYLPTAEFDAGEPGKRPPMKANSFQIVVVGSEG